MGRDAISAVCSCCGKEISFLTFSKASWAYKVVDYDCYLHYQCSYPCWRKEKERIKMAVKRDTLIKSDATKALKYDAKFRLGGGNDLKHQPSSCGIVLKWILGVKKITYSTFARQLNNTTAQNLNYLINRCDKSRFFEENIDKMCKILNIKRDYFDDVCTAVEELMEN